MDIIKEVLDYYEAAVEDVLKDDPNIPVADVRVEVWRSMIADLQEAYDDAEKERHQVKRSGDSPGRSTSGADMVFDVKFTLTVSDETPIGLVHSALEAIEFNSKKLIDREPEFDGMSVSDLDAELRVVR